MLGTKTRSSASTPNSWPVSPAQRGYTLMVRHFPRRCEEALDLIPVLWSKPRKIQNKTRKYFDIKMHDFWWFHKVHILGALQAPPARINHSSFSFLHHVSSSWSSLFLTVKVELVQIVIDGVNYLVDCEKKLERGQDIKVPPPLPQFSRKWISLSIYE